MIALTVNGEPCRSAADTLEAVFRAEAEARGIEDARGIAIALNGRVVRRAAWAETPVQAGDRVEIVRAMQGG